MEERKCPNCSISYDSNYKFCPNCGQKNGPLKVSVWQFIGTFLNMIFNLDSSFFQSLFGIFIPGKLTRDYFEGKRKKYAHPLRLFFIIAAIHISVLGYFINERLSEDNDLIKQSIKYNPKDIQENMTEFDSILQASSLVDSLTINDSLSMDLKESLKKLSRKNSLQSSQDLSFAAATDTADLIFSKDIPFVNDSVFLDIFRIPSDTLKTYSFEENKVRYNIHGFFYSTVLRQRIKMINEPEAFLRSMIANLIWMLFVLLPVIALFMKLLYIRRKKYYIEHLVFLFHWHAFAFIIMSVFLLIHPWLNFIWIFAIFGLILWFGFRALRRYYREGFFRAFFKYILILTAYFMMIFVLLIIFALITSLIF